MARRARSREAAARRRARGRRGRAPARWPRSSPAGGKASQAHGPRVVALTAARRRAIERRRLGRTAREATSPTTLDFHLGAAVACARAGARVIMEYWGKRRTYPIQEKGRNDFVTVDR